MKHIQFETYEIQFNMMKNIASKRYDEIKRLRQQVEDLKKEKEILANVVTSYLKDEIEKEHNDIIYDYELI